jgi:tetratricopeptide (TPR) repeat protein
MTRWLVLILLLLCGPGSLLAQTNPLVGETNSTTPGSIPTIEGEVRLANGTPVPFVYVRLDPENVGGMIQSTTTDSAGYYAFKGYFMGGNFTIDIEVQGFEPIHRLVMDTSPTTEENFTLVPLPASHRSQHGPLVSIEQLEIPPKARVEFRRGLQCMDAGKYAKAAAAFRKAIRLAPRFAAGYRQLSAAYASRHHFPQARLAIDHAFVLEKNNAENFAYLGYLYMEQKRDRQAARAFKHSLRISKTDWFAQLELGRLRYNQHRYEEAYTHLLMAGKLHPQILSVHLLLYDDLIQLHKPKLALNELTRFLSRFPNCPQAAQLRKTRAALAASLASRP